MQQSTNSAHKYAICSTDAKLVSVANTSHTSMLDLVRTAVVGLLGSINYYIIA
jgi:hypothetical protein